MDSKNESASSFELRSRKKLKQPKDLTLGDMKVQKGMSGYPITQLDTDRTTAPCTSSGSEKLTGRSRRHRLYSPSENEESFENKNNTMKNEKDVNTPDRKTTGPMDYLNSIINKSFRNVSSIPMGLDDQALSSRPTGQASPANHSRKKTRYLESLNHHKPAEVFRKDLISAMKIPDTSQLASTDYWVLQDSWRMEWEKGVQVPVNPNALPAAQISTVPKESCGDFRMSRKMIKSTPDAGDKDTVDLAVVAASKCQYDLDDLDVSWLQIINEERKFKGLDGLSECTMELIMEELETQCHENMQVAIKTKEGLGIEYDENIVCDVCKSPDCEEGNEMVFCDGCNLCVHQACYGILKVPEGSWLCKPCALGVRGSIACILCGQKGGAMKSTRSGRKWAHVSCALWIPEIHIADPERMEPITKISQIPPSRWSLVCSVCKQRSVGACIQCSVRHCVTAYHVTCALENRFDMITDFPSAEAQGSADNAIIFRSYCQKHSKSPKKTQEEKSGKKTLEETKTDRQQRIARLEEEFYSFVTNQAVVEALNVQSEMVFSVMEYWKLKRKCNYCRPLLLPKQENEKMLGEAAECGLQRRLRMFTHLRQDLERVRNLCYMIGRREKIKRSSVKNMENVFLAQINHVENRMSHNSNFKPQMLVPSLPLFSSPEAIHFLNKAKEETSGRLEVAALGGHETGSIRSCSAMLSDASAKESDMPRWEAEYPNTSKHHSALPAVQKSNVANLNFVDDDVMATTRFFSRRSDNLEAQRNSGKKQENSAGDKSGKEMLTGALRKRFYPTMNDDGKSKLLSSECPNRVTLDHGVSEVRKGKGHRRLSSGINGIVKKRRRLETLRHSSKPKSGSDNVSDNSSSTDVPTPTCSPPNHSMKLPDSARISAQKKKFGKEAETGRRMTITTETISETKRISGRHRKSFLEKSSSTPSIRSPSINDGITLTAKKTQDDRLSSRGKKQIESLKTQSHSSPEHGSVESLDEQSLGSRENSPGTSALLSSNRCSPRLTSKGYVSLTTSERPKKESGLHTKKGKRAVPLCNCDKNTICDKFRRNKMGNDSLHEAPQRDFCEDSLARPDDLLTSCTGGKNLTIPRSAPNKNRTKSNRISNDTLSAKGDRKLRWVSLVEDSDEQSEADVAEHVPGAMTPKDQEGYRGDMDESDSDACGSLHQQNCHRHRRSSKKLGFRKHKSCSAVIRIESPETSEEDFDTSFMSLSASGKNLGRKPTVITKTSDCELNPDTSKRLLPEVRSPVSRANAAVFDKPNREVVSKNVNAVGGTQGVLKSEPESWLPPINSTTDGKNFSDNFYNEFFPGNGKPDHHQFSPPSVQYEGANVIQYHQPQVASQNLFPFSREMAFNNSIFAWSRPLAIVPNQYPLPVFYQYPPLPQPYQKNFAGNADIPDSESCLQPSKIKNPAQASKLIVPTSSTAVQTVSFSTTDVAPGKPSMSASQDRVHTTPNEEDNEWEIVTDDLASFSQATNEQSYKPGRKRKKKKKKKKFHRSRSLEKSSRANGVVGPSSTTGNECEASSPDNGTMSDATTDMEISTRSPLVIKVTKPKTDRPSTKASVPGSREGNGIASLHRRHSRSKDKLILKIDKRAIKFFEEESEEEVRPDSNLRRANHRRCSGDDLLSTPDGEATKKGERNSASSSGPNIKLKFKISRPTKSTKGRLKRHKNLHPGHVTPVEYTVLPVTSKERLQEPAVSPKVRESAPLPGLDVTSPQDVLQEARGKRRLRERKVPGKPGDRPEESMNQKPPSTRRSKILREDRCSNRGQQKTAVRGTALRSCEMGSQRKSRKGTSMGPDSALPDSTSDVSVNIKSESTGFPGSLVPGLKKRRIKSEPLHNALIAKKTKIKQEYCDMPTNKKILPHSIGSSTKLQSAFSKQNSSDTSDKAKIGFNDCSSTFSGCTQSLNFPTGQQPTRHWKKRKVHEHETQVFKHRALEQGSLLAHSAERHRHKAVSEESNTSTLTASSYDYETGDADSQQFKWGTGVSQDQIVEAGPSAEVYR